jgi:hypothetical protein
MTSCLLLLSRLAHALIEQCQSFFKALKTLFQTTPCAPCRCSCESVFTKAVLNFPFSRVENKKPYKQAGFMPIELAA